MTWNLCALPEVLLGFMHVQHAFHPLLCVVLIVDEFALSQDEPAASPVASRECRGASTLLQQPALFECLLSAPEPQKCFILQHTPATLPGVQQATWNTHVIMTKGIGTARLPLMKCYNRFSVDRVLNCANNLRGNFNFLKNITKKQR